MKKILMSLAVAITMLFAAGGQAKASYLDGVLTCNQTGPGVTYVLFSRMPVSCSFAGVGTPQTYSGTMGILLGVDLEYAQKRAMAYWVIGGASASPALIGNYVGVKGSATLLAGPAVQAGLAGVGNGIELVPVGLGVQEVGLGATAGLAYLQLTNAGPMPAAMAQTFVVYFNFNKSDLTADGQKVIEQRRRLLQEDRRAQGRGRRLHRHLRHGGLQHGPVASPRRHRARRVDQGRRTGRQDQHRLVRQDQPRRADARWRERAAQPARHDRHPVNRRFA